MRTIRKSGYFAQRLATPTGFSLPEVFSPELLQLFIQVDLQPRFRQPRQSIRCINAITGMASAEIRSHDEPLLLALVFLHRDEVHPSELELPGARRMSEASGWPRRQ
jgi:hypothetical protein